MRTKLKKIFAILNLIVFLWFGLLDVAEARFLAHATRRALAPKIFKKGFSVSKMNPKARFGGNIYFSKNIKTALKEKPHAQSVLLFKKGRSFNNRLLDTRKMTGKRLRVISRLKDMRGTVKKGVIGPKIGHKIANFASRNNKIIAYRSARYARGTNYAIPPKVYSQNNRIVRFVRKVDVR